MNAGGGVSSAHPGEQRPECDEKSFETHDGSPARRRQAVVSARQLMRGAFLIARSAATQLID
jgi:hypothetical protein